MNKMNKALLIASAIWLTSSPLWAGITPIDGATSFLPGPINITFDNPIVSPDTPVTTQYAALGATFSGAVSGDVGNIGIPNQDGYTIQDFISSGPNFQPLTINFNSPVTAADFAMTYQPGTATITAYLGGVQVDQFVGVSTNLFQTNNIYGFQGGAFNQISVVINMNDHADIIDNLQFRSAPEPASIVTWGIACAAGLFVVRRRRRKA